MSALVVSASKLGGAGFLLSIIIPSSGLNSPKIRAAHTSSADLQGDRNIGKTKVNRNKNNTYLFIS